jgi:hypothetical protein
MYSGSPLNNYIDHSSSHPPHRTLHPSICHSTTTYSQHNVNPSPPSVVNRKQTPTGTRKHLSVEALLPLDAPIQSRRYLTPSATARKDAFPHMRWRGSGGDEPDELLDESNTTPAADLKALEWKRQQNTLAARKSRQRKLQHQLQLEETVSTLSTEKEAWRARAMMYEALLRSNGINVPEFS